MSKDKDEVLPVEEERKAEKRLAKQLARWNAVFGKKK